MTLLLDDAAVGAVLDMEPLVDLMAETLAAFSRGACVQPVRAVIAMPHHATTTLVMPGYLAGGDALGLKVVSIAERNAARGLPTHLATLLLIDPETGALDAILDARRITAMRTAAVSAAAARALARDDAGVLALVGSGVQAATHLEAFRLVRPIARVRVWSPDRARREAFALAQSARHGMRVDAVAHAEDAVRGADLVVTATASTVPVVRGVWLEPGAHVTAVGASRADARELDGAAIARAEVYVDARAAARIEAGDVLLAEAEGAVAVDHVRGEIGEVFEGRVPGRSGPGAITLFKSLGLAVEDVATARHVVDRARARGVGVEITL